MEVLLHLCMIMDGVIFEADCGLAFLILVKFVALMFPSAIPAIRAPIGCVEPLATVLEPVLPAVVTFVVVVCSLVCASSLEGSPVVSSEVTSASAPWCWCLLGLVLGFVGSGAMACDASCLCVNEHLSHHESGVVSLLVAREGISEDLHCIIVDHWWFACSGAAIIGFSVRFGKCV